jgi:hypothetical protein
VRVLQLRREADLGEEALAADHGTELGMQHLDGDLALVLEVLGEVDGGHPALAELALEPVAVGEAGAQAFGDGRRHRVASRPGATGESARAP